MPVIDRVQIRKMAAYYATQTVADPERYGVQTYNKAFAHMIQTLSEAV